jgi:hypothetical protein
MNDVYDQWNTAIAEHFFREEFAGKQVFLFVDDGLITSLARQHDLPEESFFSAVVPPHSNAADVAHRCLAKCKRGRWRKNTAAVYPPYLVYLALFVLAAGLDEPDLPDHAYYNRLSRYLRLPDGISLPGFNRLGDEVWRDLETWSTHDLDGTLGIFGVRIFGHQRHVGIPRSQTLLWKEEISTLPRIFADAGLDPTDDPTDRLLVQSLQKHAGELRAPTRRVLLRPREDVLRTALLDVIRGELADWDGAVADPEDGDRQGKIFGNLRLFLDPQPARRTGSSTLRCTLSSPYPDHALTLTNDHLTYNCEELMAPWSTRLTQPNGMLVNAAELDWTTGVRVTESTLGWRFTLRGASIRVFESAEAHGLRGWVEVSRLDHGKTFLIACRDKDLAAVLAWGTSSCSECTVQNFPGMLPVGWRLVEVRDVQNDEGIRDMSPAIGLPSTARIRLVGGVKSGRGTKYYAFAPPRVHVSGISGDENVDLDGRHLGISISGPIPLPERLPRGEALTITVRKENRLVASQSLVLLDDIDWTATTTSRVDTYGDSCLPPGFSGAFAEGTLADKAALFHPAVMLPPASKAVLLGRRPGEVCDWPKEQWPDWDPVWAITPSVRGRTNRPVVYCGSDTKRSHPLMSEPTGDRRRMRRWKVEIWTLRKRNMPPANPTLNLLWDRFLKAGRG